MLGRFLAVDPLASKNPGWSPYVYVLNNPLVRIDPFGLTDIMINIQRTTETTQSTIGEYTVANSANRSRLSGSTLEKPWKNNQQYKSRIKAGSYSANLRTKKISLAYPRIALKGVSGRSKIVIHRGNTADNTSGCILVGKTAGEDRVNESEAALTEITDYVQTIQTGDKKKGEKTTITVKVVDPPKKEEAKTGDEAK